MPKSPATNGLKAGYGRRYHWLDLQALVRDLLRPGQELLEVQYFTARVQDKPPRMQELRRALDSDLRPAVAAVKNLGTGKRIVAAMPSCHPRLSPGAA